MGSLTEIRRVPRKIERTPEQLAELRAVREQFRRDRPTLEDLIASGELRGALSSGRHHGVSLGHGNAQARAAGPEPGRRVAAVGVGQGDALAARGRRAPEPDAEHALALRRGDRHADHDRGRGRAGRADADRPGPPLALPCRARTALPSVERAARAARPARPAGPAHGRVRRGGKVSGDGLSRTIPPLSRDRQSLPGRRRPSA
jgi:hypothetical protein